MKWASVIGSPVDERGRGVASAIGVQGGAWDDADRVREADAYMGRMMGEGSSREKKIEVRETDVDR